MPGYVIAEIEITDPTAFDVLEFPSVEQARRWYDSEEYRGPKALRMKASRGKVILVEGAS